MICAVDLADVSCVVHVHSTYSDGTATMGTEAPAGRAVLRVRLPREADMRVIRDGSPVHEVRGAALDFDVYQAGRYRMEARIDGRAWLLSNPVYLGRASGRRTRL